MTIYQCGDYRIEVEVLTTWTETLGGVEGVGAKLQLPDGEIVDVWQALGVNDWTLEEGA